MGYKAKYYDKKTKTDKVWHNSSMIVYTEMVEDPDHNYGDLTVVFNNGSTYRYKNVDFLDYIMISNGGLDGSNGKAFNKMIKEKRYEYEKIEPLTKEYIEAEFEKVQDKINNRANTIFFSGPEDFTTEEFEVFITPKIYTIDNDTRFFVADTEKFGRHIQKYLIEMVKIDADRITVFRKKDDADYSYPGVNVNDFYDTDGEADHDMTKWSGIDAAIVRDWDSKVTRESKNILRRYIKTI